MQSIHVHAQKPYDIIIGSDLISKAGEIIEPLTRSNKIIIITDKNVASIHLKKLEIGLSSFEHTTHVLESGEHIKSFKYLEILLEDILASTPDRNITLIAFGGGVIGDLVGLAASVLLRGVNYIQIPTTLLAQVDSSVGGKTAIDSKSGKNLIGSFCQPLVVIIDVKVLESLPKRQLLSGYAEVLKYSMIHDTEFFIWLDTNAHNIQDTDILQYLINRSCEIKAKIVSIDEFDTKNVRALLNFGHTFAHAMEIVTNYSDILLHGEAVGIGMLLATKLSIKLGFCKENALHMLHNHMQRVGLLCNFDFKFDIEKLITAMCSDKKNCNNMHNFILLRAIGQAFFAEDIDINTVRDILVDYYCE